MAAESIQPSFWQAELIVSESPYKQPQSEQSSLLHIAVGSKERLLARSYLSLLTTIYYIQSLIHNDTESETCCLSPSSSCLRKKGQSLDDLFKNYENLYQKSC